ncbi:IclR family transcriptional regulator [Pararoseomonas indoligenes]|uniref:Helix-turn-helix domain-containing protein n=1 Tax=Roseomonas indoligenes TaxID=2820811 RepID=A0A940N0A7_9PROT|nr:helix-turn-helix domain-containing protein [Pararoseomonas indoligenes]MBP0494169.1 helix-turn-helix domain-containing protein [Pararoseomonas indoligenes]
MTTPTRPNASLEGVASAGRALTLLSAFRKGDDAVTLAELTARTGLVKTTVMRLAISLEEHGYLTRLPDGAYRLGAELFRLGSVYQQSFRVEAYVMPVLERLVAETSESASFYVRSGEHRLCLYRVDSPHRLRLHVRQGDMLPMDNSAIAQVLRIFGAVPLPPEAASMEVPLYTGGERDPHVAGMATPVFGPGESFAGALCLTGPVTRLTRQAAEDASPSLLGAAAELTRSLGGLGLAAGR